MNLHFVVSDFIPIIVIYHDRLALKLQFSHRSPTLYRLVLAFAGAAGQLNPNRNQLKIDDGAYKE